MARVRKVTLMVDMQQAKALQLAQDVGVISLALRNPQDKARNPDSTPVSLRLIAGLPAPVNSMALSPELTLVRADARAATKAAASPPPPVEPREWKTTVLRGSNSETLAFPLPAKEQETPRN